MSKAGCKVTISQSCKVVRVSSKVMPEVTKLAPSQDNLEATLILAASLRLSSRMRRALIVIEKVLWEANLRLKVTKSLVPSTMQRTSWLLPTSDNMPSNILEDT